MIFRKQGKTRVIELSAGDSALVYDHANQCLVTIIAPTESGESTRLIDGFLYWVRENAETIIDRLTEE